MKKIVSILLLTFTFSFSGNAQKSLSINNDSKKESNIKEVVYNEVEELSSAVKLDTNFKDEIVKILFMREDAISKTEDLKEKIKIHEQVGVKILGALNKDQLAALKNKPDLYKRLTTYQEK